MRPLRSTRRSTKDDEDSVEAAHAKYNDEHKDEICDEAVDRYKCAHADEDDFVQSSLERYIEGHEEEILETAADNYKEEHKDEANVRKAAKLLLRDEL